MPSGASQDDPTGSSTLCAVSLLVAHPSPDLYGSDLKLVETVRGVSGKGHEVVVVLPEDGPLVALLEQSGATVEIMPFPVLRKSLLSPKGLLSLMFMVPVFLLRTRSLWRRLQPDRVLVNTMTIPWWLLAARLHRVPVVCHVREAEETQARPVRFAVTLPLMLATSLIANSSASRDVLARNLPKIGARTKVIYNGFAAPEQTAPPRNRSANDPAVVVLVGRLSPRKGTDVALEAVARLRAEGRDIRIRLCGSVFPGYEWFETSLRERAEQPDLVGAVDFLGYVSRPQAEVERADIVLVPSLVEPFGNVAVEALLAQRPLVASRVQGLCEIVREGETGILVEPGDSAELTEAIRRMLDDPDLAAELAAAGRHDVVERFGVERYHREIRREVLGA